MPVHIIENAGPPTTAPSAIGIHFIDTVSGIHYFSTGTSTVADWAREDKVIEDTVPPSGAPPAIGLHWIDTATGIEYFSTGTSAVEDWKERGGGGGGGGGGFAATLKHFQIAPGRAIGVTPQANFPRISDDGGKNWRGRYTGDRIGVKWNDLSDGGMMQGLLDDGQGTMWHGTSFPDGTPMTGMRIRWTRDNSASSPWGRNTQNIYDKDSVVLVNHAGEDVFAYVARNDVTTSNILCLRTLANDGSAGEYITYSSNSGSTFFNTIILPPADPLRVHIETGAIPAMYGLWSFGGNYFAALETTQGDFEDVTVFRSTDLGANWTSYATFEDFGGIHAGHATALNKSGPAFVHGAYDGKLVVPGVGVFVFASDNGTNHCPVIYKDSDGASGFLTVYTFGDVYSEGSCPNPPVHWEMNMHGWLVDEVSGDTIIWAVLYNDTTGTRTTVISEDDGASWSEYGIFDNDSGYYIPYPLYGHSAPFPSGWNRCWQPFWYDGYACRGFYNNGTDAGAIMTLDGLAFFADPYLNRSMGATVDPYFEQLKAAAGTPNWWPIVTLF